MGRSPAFVSVASGCLHLEAVNGDPARYMPAIEAVPSLPNNSLKPTRWAGSCRRMNCPRIWSRMWKPSPLPPNSLARGRLASPARATCPTAHSFATRRQECPRKAPHAQRPPPLGLPPIPRTAWSSRTSTSMATQLSSMPPCSQRCGLLSSRSSQLSHQDSPKRRCGPRLFASFHKLSSPAAQRQDGGPSAFS